MVRYTGRKRKAKRTSQDRGQLAQESQAEEVIYDRGTRPGQPRDIT
jgi:hypothetical protein